MLSRAALLPEQGGGPCRRVKLRSAQGQDQAFPSAACTFSAVPFEAGRSRFTEKVEQRGMPDPDPESTASVVSRNAAGYHVYEVLQVAGGPALEGAVAVALVGGHHRVAVVPVELRLGVEPEEAAGAL